MKANSQLILEAILNDKQLQQLNAEMVKIYTLAIPMVIMKDGKIETMWIDESNHPLLSKIDELIKHRTEQIKHFFGMTKSFYCQSEIEDDGKCEKQCEHCKEYYRPLEQ